MFEDSLMESTGRIHTRRKWTAAGSLLLQALLLGVLLLLPEIYPEALPKQAMARLLIAPPPPPSPPARPQLESVPRHSATAAAQPIDPYSAPRTIPQHAALGVHDEPAPALSASALDSGSRPGIPGGIGDLLIHATSPPVVRPDAHRGPLRVSSGIAAGQLLSPIRAAYPAIAKATRTQGTVVVEATISKQGTIENLRVVSGPVMLQSAATEAVRTARYRPFLLDGEPVEVQTTISVIFSLGG